MKSIIRIGLIITFLALNFQFSILQAQIYVSDTATGNNDGTSWTDAYVYLQDALAAASSGDEIWITAGIYYPDEGSSQTDGDRTAYFNLVSGVSLYGGFNGTETSRYQASPTQNVSILSGDIDKDNTKDNDNSYHVVYANGLSAAVELSGLTIQYGYANGSSPEEQGGGLYNFDTQNYLTVSNCIFENNYASGQGGGVKNDGSSTNAMRTTFQNCIFRNNTGHGGGGMQIVVNSPNSIDVLLINGLFYGNTSTGNGGAIYSTGGSLNNLYATNCTFYDNNATWNGKGLRVGGYTHHELTNCIIWDNGSDEFVNSGNGSTTVTNCIIKLSSLPSNTIDGGNNLLNSDPLFEDAANDDFTVQTSSPAIDAGTNSVDLDGSSSGTDTIGNIGQDLQGLPRTDNDIVDIGVYEINECGCNHATGEGAMENITSGIGNTIYGDSSGVNLTTGSYNSMMGYQAGYSLTTGDSSIIMGYQAGYSTTIGSENILMGYLAGYNNTSGYKNYFLGREAGFYNTTGHDNIAIGRRAGRGLGSGYNNIFIGYNSSISNEEMSGHDNIFIGNDSGIDCISGSYNVAVGQNGDFLTYASGEYITEATYNTLYGAGAGGSVVDGTWNTCLGFEAGFFTQHGDYNTMVGHQAGWDNNRTNGKSDANNNTMIGSMAGSTNRTGSNHLIVGANADIDDDEKDNGTGIGGGIQFGEDNVTVLGYGATVDGNYGLAIGNYVEVDYIGGIGIGYETDISKNYSIGIGHQTTITYIHSIGIGYQTNISEEYSIGIGNSSTVSGAYSIALGSGSSNTTYNAAAIGYGTTVGGNHEIAFGNASTTTIGGTVDFTSLSDGRFKTNIQENVIGLDFIRELRPVTYQLTANGLNAIRQTGFIAQEVEQASNKLNFSFSGIDYRKNQDLYGLRYAEFVVPLVKAIQELQPKIENQQVVLENQQAQFNQYHQQLLELAAELEQLENN